MTYKVNHTMKKQYLKFNEPGHGWLKVPMTEVKQAISEGVKLTAYSYQSPSGKYAYLEEDCDLNAFLAWRLNDSEWYQCWEKGSNKPKPYITRYTPRDRQSTVRNYPHLSVGERGAGL